MKTKYEQLTIQEQKILKRYYLVRWHWFTNHEQGAEERASGYYREMSGLMYALDALQIDFRNIKAPEDEQ